MNIIAIKFPNEKILNSFLSGAQKKLLNQIKIKEFFYPKVLRNGKRASWEKHIPEIKRQNEAKLKEVSSKAGVYALFTRCSNKKKWELKYIGQTASKHSRTRITNHLITKHKDTGAKLETVRKEVQSGKHVGITFVEVQPPELRHFLEEKLISANNPKWNQHKRKAL